MSKRKLVELSLEKKKEVLDRIREGRSCMRLAEEYGISKTTVYNIKSNEGAITAAWERSQACSPERKRKVRKTPHDEVNSKLLEYYQSCCGENVSGRILKEKAKQIAAQLGFTEFSASNGWLDGFRKRYNINFRVPSAAEDWKKNLPDITAGYNSKDIFSAGATGFFFRQDLTNAGNDASEEMLKECVTVLFCCSVHGEKQKPLVISKSAVPCTFDQNDVKMHDLTVTWRFNARGQMTTEIFAEWLQGVDCNMKEQKRKILLLVDNDTSQGYVELSNVVLKFLPTNLTREVQPLDRGIIQSVKRKYQIQLLRSLTSAVDRFNSVSNFMRSITVLEAVRWISTAWEDVSEETIGKCFHSAGFMRSDANGCDEDYVKSLEEELGALHEEYLRQLASANEIVNLTPLILCDGNPEEMLKLEDSESDPLEDGDTETPDVKPPSHQDALEYIKKLQHYASVHQPTIIKEIYAARQKIEKSVMKERAESLKQSVVSEFFT